MNHRVARKCKACEPCRARKVKCNGLRPVCSLCQAQRRQCEYGEDRRQNHAVSRQTVQLMKDKMAALEATIEAMAAQPGAQSRSTPTLEDPMLRENSNAGTSPTSTMPPPSSPQRVRHGSVSSGVIRRNSGHVVEASEMHTIVRSEIGYSIHGPTSAFRDLPSPASLSRTSISDAAGSPTRTHAANALPLTSEEDKRKQLEQWRLELFAHSARQQQLEPLLISQCKMDLDGVDGHTAKHLLDLYFNHQYNTYLCMYRPAVMDSLATNGPYANKLILNAMLYTGALQSGREDLMDEPGDAQTLGNRFFRRFEELLPLFMRSSSIPTISALIVMGSSLLTRGYQTLAWLYYGISYRMILDLGFDINPAKVNTSSLLAKESAYSQNAMEAELQRRVFWGAYMNDRFNSLYFGRPPSLTILHGFEPDRECLDTHDEMDMWSPRYDMLKPPSVHITAPRYNVSNRNSLLKLADITSVIIDKFYRPGLEYPSAEAAREQVQSVQAQLDEWAETLPAHLYYTPEKDTPIPPHRFYPHTTYHTLHILLYRPFLPEGHLRSIQPLPQPAIRERCITAALRIYALAQAYRAAFTLTRAPYLFSYALFSAATVIPLLHWEDGKKRLDVIRFFLDALKEQQRGANSGLKKPIMIIRGMFERAGLDLSSSTHPNHVHSNERAGNGGSSTTAGATTSNATPGRGFDAAMEGWEGWADGQDYRDLFQDFLMENEAFWPGLDSVVAGEEQPEMLFGMFG